MRKVNIYSRLLAVICLTSWLQIALCDTPVPSFDDLNRLIQAEPENAQAWFDMGVMYETGQGVRQNRELARQTYLRAVNLGNAPAMFNLGSLYAGQQDYKQALHWWQAAAEADVPQAQFNLAMLYEKGWGVEKDPQLATNWYQRAARTALGLYSLQYRNTFGELQTGPGSGTSNTHTDDYQRIVKNGDQIKRQGVETISRPQRTSALAMWFGFIDSAHAETDPPEEQDSGAGWVWVYEQPADNYTIQLFATREKSKTDKFIKQYALIDRAVVIPAIVKGSKYYKVILGSFSEWNSAAVEIGGLPQDLRDQRPWVRKIITLYDELPEGVDTTAAIAADSSSSEPTPVSADIQPAAIGDSAPEQLAAVEQLSVAEPQAPVVPATKPSVTAQPASDPPVEPAATAVSIIDPVVEAPPQTQQQAESGQIEVAKVQTLDRVKLFVPRDIDPGQLSQLEIAIASVHSENYEQALDQLTPLAQSGLAEAQYHSAILFSKGEGTGQDAERAFELMKMAAEQGHPYAQMELARFYSQGIGVAVSPGLGNYWMQTGEDNLARLQEQ